MLEFPCHFGLEIFPRGNDKTSWSFRNVKEWREPPCHWAAPLVKRDLLPEPPPPHPGKPYQSGPDKKQCAGFRDLGRRRIAYPNHKVLVIPIRDGKRQILPRQDVTGRVFLEHQHVRGLISIQKILGVPGTQRRLETKSAYSNNRDAVAGEKVRQRP